MSRVEPPSGAIPPQAFELADGTTVDLGPLAQQLCRDYFGLYPDDIERYGPAGQAWCEHDSRYLLAWALEDARAGIVNCVEQVQWLGRVLGARSYPIERLAAHVQLTAAALRTAELGETGSHAADRLNQAAAALASASAD
ncbi:MAG: hypothetical protein ACLP8S_05980 [Solirubrobacteraceae bacterium]